MVNIKHFNVKLDDDTDDWITNQAKENNINKSEVVRAVLKGWINGNQHKGFIKVEVKKDSVNRKKFWMGILMSNADNILKKAKEYYIFETFFNSNLKDTNTSFSNKAINALLDVLKEDKEKMKEITGNMYLLAEMDDLIIAVKNRDLPKLKTLIHPEDVRMNRYMKGNFGDLSHSEMTKLRIFMKELKQ